jgi:hypothetical protein
MRCTSVTVVAGKLLIIHQACRCVSCRQPILPQLAFIDCGVMCLLWRYVLVNAVAFAAEALTAAACSITSTASAVAIAAVAGYSCISSSRRVTHDAASSCRIHVAAAAAAVH